MRRVLVALFASAAVVAAAAPALARDLAPGDGAFSVQSGNGVVALTIRGGLIGRIDTGRVTIDDAEPDEGSDPVVWGFEKSRELPDGSTVYSGEDIRFRIIGGLFRVRAAASGINLSAVGRGTILLDGAGSEDDGTYSVNGEDDEPLPAAASKLTLALGPVGPPQPVPQPQPGPRPSPGG